MKFNNRELLELYLGPSDIEGRLHHRKGHKSGFKERWFKLKYNLLFYHDIESTVQFDRMLPSGVIILENYVINVDIARESCFAFSITFRDETQKRHIFSGQSEFHIEQWICAVKRASYGFWRSQLILLQQRISGKTGKDPLLMYPRNEGTIRNEAWERKESFRSHIKSFSTTTTSNPTVTVSNASSNPTEISLIDFA